MTRQVPNPTDEPTIDVPRYAAIMGTGLHAVYEDIKRGHIPVIRVGKHLRISSAYVVHQLEAAS